MIISQFTNYKNVLRDDSEKVTRPIERSSLISEENVWTVKQLLNKLKL